MSELPWIVTEDREARRRLQFPPGPGTGRCPICANWGAGAHLGQRVWAYGCSMCAHRGQTPRRLNLAPYYGLGAELGEAAIPQMRAEIERLVATGNGLLGTVPSADSVECVGWTRAVWGGTPRWTLDRPLGCMHCGESHSATVRVDKHARPYVNCQVCSSKTFTYTRHSACAWTGLGLLLSERRLDWLRLHERGERELASWTLPLGRADGAVETHETSLEIAHV